MPGEQVFVIAQSPCEGELEVVREADAITVYGWSESRVEVVRDQRTVEAAAAPDAGRVAANEEHERRNAESLEAYYVKTGQRAPSLETGEIAGFARVLAEPGSTDARRELLTVWKAGGNPT